MDARQSRSVWTARVFSTAFGWAEEVQVTGSFNFTKAAEQSNAENLLVIEDSALAAKYTANWQIHAKHAELYHRKLKNQ